MELILFQMEIFHHRNLRNFFQTNGRDFLIWNEQKINEFKMRSGSKNLHGSDSHTGLKGFQPAEDHKYYCLSKITWIFLLLVPA